MFEIVFDSKYPVHLPDFEIYKYSYRAFHKRNQLKFAVLL